MSSTSGLRVLILGGTGMVGRSFLKYLLDLGVCSCIRVADKLLPQISFMLPEQEAMFDNPVVEFVQADLTKEAHLDRVFKPPANWEGERIFDYVFNLAAETRYGQAVPLYESRCTELSKLCAQRASLIKCLRYVEVSTALVYKSQARTAADEDYKLSPWTSQSAAKLAAEEEVKKVSQTAMGLDYVILRPAIIYGPADVNGLMPRIVCAAAYVELGETMKFLWDAGIKINTVHVSDVCKAMWTVAHTNRDQVPSGTVYNLADRGDTDVGTVNAFLSELFGIKTGFHGSILSNVARLRLADVVDIANEKHLKPWDTLCKTHNVDRTPLSPFMSLELLDSNHLFINGSKIERDTDFVYGVPIIQKRHLQESVEAAIEAHIFPPILVKK